MLLFLYDSEQEQPPGQERQQGVVFRALVPHPLPKMLQSCIKRSGRTKYTDGGIKFLLLPSNPTFILYLPLLRIQDSAPKFSLFLDPCHNFLYFSPKLPFLRIIFYIFVWIPKIFQTILPFFFLFKIILMIRRLINFFMLIMQ
jgi:hypothetical protein